jgi:hypothetical protein
MTTFGGNVLRAAVCRARHVGRGDGRGPSKVEPPNYACAFFGGSQAFGPVHRVADSCGSDLNSERVDLNDNFCAFVDTEQ